MFFHGEFHLFILAQRYSCVISKSCATHRRAVNQTNPPLCHIENHQRQSDVSFSPRIYEKVSWCSKRERGRRGARKEAGGRMTELKNGRRQREWGGGGWRRGGGEPGRGGWIDERRQGSVAWEKCGEINCHGRRNYNYTSRALFISTAVCTLTSV